MNAEKIDSILKVLKEVKWPAKKVEEKLGFSNGLLGKAAKGKINLSDEKFSMLKSFADDQEFILAASSLSKRNIGRELAKEIPIPAVNVGINTGDFDKFDLNKTYPITTSDSTIYNPEVTKLKQDLGIKTGNEIPVKEFAPKPMSQDEADREQQKMLDVILGGHIRRFCEKEGITSEDLVDAYRNSKTAKNGKKEKLSDVVDNSDKPAKGGNKYLEMRQKAKNGMG